MADTLTNKILKAHLADGDLQPGSPLGIRIDQTLTQDATGTMAYLQFEAMGINTVRTEISVSYVDHNTQQTDYRNMDDHRFLQSAAARYGVYFSRHGNGICHQVHLERFGKPGKTLLGSDSHTPTGGGLAMLAIGAGGLDVAAAMAGAPFYLTAPQVVGVYLTGSLQPRVSAKDIILTILATETVSGGVGKIYEYFGPGIKSLTVPERATITNMGAELGATTSLFPSDEQTKAFLASQQRETDWVPLQADEDASYARIIDVDLSKVVPMAALPHMPDKAVPVEEVAGLEIQQVAIGSCTNSSISDLAHTAALLRGKKVHPRLSLGVAPGSRQVLAAAARSGILADLIESGARILESACGPCIGMGFAPSSGGRSLRTFNRNFKGRSGTADAEIYLVSPETAAASALTGVITDPRTLSFEAGEDYHPVMLPDDGMIIPPLEPAEAARVTLIRGPNIAPCPAGSPVPDRLEAPVILKTGDNITTDDIMPAGSAILPLRSNIPAMAEYVFTHLDSNFSHRAKAAGEGIILGGENYGQGSSREHAALAPMYLGIRAVIAKSFARIHRANLINFGILPLTMDNPADYDALEQGDILVLEGLRHSLEKGTPIQARNLTNNRFFSLSHGCAGRTAAILQAGGLLRFVGRGKEK
ncbi:MAG: aconitate hydratase [Spirochaetales bacterium]|nr:aconitate hydratase [Spirochaetales bacterium]